MESIKLRAIFSKLSNSKKCWQKMFISKGSITDTSNMFGYVQKTDWEQYSGINDKNGKDIYEGDIIDVQYNYIGRHSVVFKDGIFSCSGFKLSSCEVIGNIHDRPFE